MGTGVEVERTRHSPCRAWWSGEDAAGHEVGEAGRTQTDQSGLCWPQILPQVPWEPAGLGASE